MRELYITNSLSRKKEIFKPINEGHIGLYVCGPTVYGDAHLGHARPGVTYDVFVKLLRHLGYKVRYVRNITDVGHLEHDADEGEDKIAKKARLEQLEPMEVVQSGFPCDKFCFEGFLPQKKGRKKRLAALAEESRTMIFYESPFRVLKALGEFGEVFGMERRVSVSRELSKKFEQTVRGTIAEVTAHFEAHPPKGEFVMVVGGANGKDSKDEIEDNE